MELFLSDPSYTDRLASFLKSVGQTAIVTGPGRVDVDVVPESGGLAELRIYLGVWDVLYPGTDVQLGADGDEVGAA